MNETKECIFCSIAERRQPAKIVYEDERFIAIEDNNPQAPVHILVIPKKHIPEIQFLSAQDGELAKEWFWTAVKIAREQGLEQDGYRTVINNRVGGGQTVFHVHIHLLAGRRFSWPPG